MISATTTRSPCDSFPASHLRHASAAVTPGSMGNEAQRTRIEEDRSAHGNTARAFGPPASRRFRFIDSFRCSNSRVRRAISSSVAYSNSHFASRSMVGWFGFATAPVGRPCSINRRAYSEASTPRRAAVSRSRASTSGEMSMDKVIGKSYHAASSLAADDRRKDANWEMQMVKLDITVEEASDNCVASYFLLRLPPEVSRTGKSYGQESSAVQRVTRAALESASSSGDATFPRLPAAPCHENAAAYWKNPAHGQLARHRFRAGVLLSYDITSAIPGGRRHGMIW